MALRPLNSVGGFSVGEVPANVIYPNSDFSGANATFAGNLRISNATASWGVFTDNLYYSNGTPWDFQLPGGSNTQVQFNDNGDFGGSANFYFNKTSNTLTLDGNFNVTTIEVTNVIIANSFVGNLSNGNSRVSIPVANGNVITAVNNSNILFVTSDGANLNGNLTATSNVTANGITSLGNLTVNNYIFSSGSSSLYIDPASGYLIVDGNVNPNAAGLSLGNSSARWGNLFANAGNFSANLSAGNTDAGNMLTSNFANIASNLVTNNATVNLELAGNTANFTGNVVVPNLTVNLELAGNTANFTGNVQVNNLDVNAELSGNTANFVGNVITPNLTVNLELAGNTANFTGNVQVNNLDVNAELSGNTANFTGNVVVPNLTVNLELQANTANFDGNVVMDNWLTVANIANVGTLRTDNLQYSNGANWDLQQAAGSNYEIQFNLNDDFAASPNLTFDGNTLGVTGNANVTGTVNTTDINGGSSGISLTANGFTTYLHANGNATFPGSINASEFVGNFSGNVSAGGSNTQVLFNDNSIANGAAGLTYNKTSNLVSISGNVNLGLAGFNQMVNLSNSALEIRGGWNQDQSTAVNIVAGDYSNSSNWGKISIQGNVSGNSIAYHEANFSIFTSPGYGAGNVIKFDVLNPTATTTTSGAIQVAGGIGITGDQYIGGNLSVAGNIANANNVSVTNALNGNTANFSGNLTAANANLGNLATANYVNVAFDLNGNIANFSGNLTAANANLGNLATANYINVANDLHVLGNVTAGNLVGPLANGNSNVKVYQNANVEVSVAGTANVATFTATTFYVVGDINSTTGNMLANGNITANGTLNGANANVTGEGLFGSVKTANITAPTGNITISAAGSNENIILNPSGTGVVTVGLHRISDVGDPTAPHDAATKEYVDNVSQGLFIHAPANVVATGNLNATYAGHLTTLTVTDISGGKTITFSTNHGLAVNDDIEFQNSFNGLIAAPEEYFVETVPAPNQITVRDGYFGAEVTTLTNGTGLSQTARPNGAVGATLTNAGAQAALTVDSILMTVGARVLVVGQTNQAYNGIYEVTTVGTGSTDWVLTRAADGDEYVPKSATNLCGGSYFFITQGTNNGGASYVLTSPQGEINIGTTNIVFTEFSKAGSYTAGNGINISGTIISANVDGVTTDIVGGNIVVKTSANLTTPNIGDATFSSLTWNSLSNGNITANNLSIGNLANITGTLTVDGNILGNLNIAANGNVSGANLTTSGNVQAGGNITANYITANYTLFSSNANVSGTTITDMLTVNNAITGNTANFSGNVVVPNLTVNLEVAGNTANFTGNVRSNNLTVNLELAGNTANFTGNVIVPNLTVNLELAGNTANFTGNVRSNNLTVNLELAGNTANFSGNVIVPNLTVNLELAGNTANFTGNVIVPNLTVNLELAGNTANFTGSVYAGNVYANSGLVSGNALNTETKIDIGNTAITWGTVTTSSITANQTIAEIPVSGVTGIEFLVKGVDSTGSKYSVATVQAVTDGSNVDYSVFGTVFIGSTTGTLVVNITAGNVMLQVTPASTNSTLWTTQFRTI